MKIIITSLSLVIVGLVLYIVFGLGYTKIFVNDHNLLIDTHGRYNYEVGYIQMNDPQDLASFRLISDDGSELDIAQILTVVRPFNTAIGLNANAGINRQNAALPPGVWSKLDETSQTTNSEISIWLDDKGTVTHFGFVPDGGMRFRLRGVNFSMYDDVIFMKMVDKLHIDHAQIQRSFIFPWDL